MCTGAVCTDILKNECRCVCVHGLMWGGEIPGVQILPQCYYLCSWKDIALYQMMFKKDSLASLPGCLENT